MTMVKPVPAKLLNTTEMLAQITHTQLLWTAAGLLQLRVSVCVFLITVDGNVKGLVQMLQCDSVAVEIGDSAALELSE